MPDVSTLQSVADLRGSVFAKGKADRDDFVHALEWNGEDSPEYRQLLADVAVDLFIDQADPPQYISLETADWLIARIKAHTLSYAAKIQLLSALMQYAVSLPSSLSSFLLGEVEAAVVDGQPGHPAGRLDAADVEVLRRALYAADDGASLHVTRAEAEILFRIAHSCAGKAIDPGFDDLFAKAVGNHLMAIAFRGATPVADKLALEKFENAPSLRRRLPARHGRPFAAERGGSGKPARARRGDLARQERRGRPLAGSVRKDRPGRDDLALRPSHPARRHDARPSAACWNS